MIGTGGQVLVCEIQSLPSCRPLAVSPPHTSSNLFVRDRSYPVAIFWIFAPTGCEISLLQLHSQWSRLACTYTPSVHACDRRDLHACSAQKDLFAGVEFSAINAPLLNLHAKFLLD